MGFVAVGEKEDGLFELGRGGGAGWQWIGESSPEAEAGSCTNQR